MDNTLEVGDVIFIESRNGISKIKIDRVTHKRAFSGSYEFKRELTPSGEPKRIGDGVWSTNSYYLPNDELNSKWERQKLQIQLREIQETLKSLPSEAIMKILDIHKEYKSQPTT